MSRQGRAAVIAGLWVVAFGLNTAVAQSTIEAGPASEGGSADDRCKVEVRVLGASRQSTLTAGPRIEVDSVPGIGDQLAPLAFSNYHAVDFQESEVVRRKRKVFRVRGLDKELHSVSVRILDMVKDKVRLSVKWKGPTGDRLVRARVRVNNGQNMVLGAEDSDDVSMIIMVRVNCDEEHRKPGLVKGK